MKLDYFVNASQTPIMFSQGKLNFAFYVKLNGTNVADADVIAMANNLPAKMFSQSILRYNGQILKTTNYFNFMDAMSWLELDHSSNKRTTYHYFADSNDQLVKTKYTATSTSTAVGAVGGTPTITSAVVDNANYNPGYDYRHTAIVGGAYVEFWVDIALIHRFLLDFDKIIAGANWQLTFNLSDPATWFVCGSGGSAPASPIQVYFDHCRLMIPQVSPASDYLPMLVDQTKISEIVYEYEEIETDLVKTGADISAGSTWNIELPSKTSTPSVLIVLMQPDSTITSRTGNSSIYRPYVTNSSITSIQYDLQINKVNIETEKPGVDITHNNWVRFYDAYQQMCSKKEKYSTLLDYSQFKYYLPYIVDLNKFSTIIPPNGKAYNVDLKLTPQGDKIASGTDIWFIWLTQKKMVISSDGVDVKIRDVDASYTASK